jgi:prepilin peptidase CpaA
VNDSEKFMDNAFPILAGSAMTFTAIAMILDLKTRRIPNWLTVGAFVLGLVFHASNAGLAGVGTSLAGFGVGFGMLLVLWLIGGGGGGDVKMMGALGAWLGATPIIVVFLASAIIAVLSIFGVFVYRLAMGGMQAAAHAGTSSDESAQTVRAVQLIPYAVPVAVATWVLMVLKLIAFAA